MVTIGSQARGLIGFITCTSGLIAARNVGDRPLSSPSGTAMSVPIRKPRPTVRSDVQT